MLGELRNKIVKELSPDGETRDGMDISLIRIDLKSNEAVWAGANNPLWIIRNGKKQIEIIKPDKQPIGFSEKTQEFSDHNIQFNKGDLLYLFSDGYADQFGGAEIRKGGKKLKEANFRKKVEEISGYNLKEQSALLTEYFENWKGDLEQVDDVCVLGMRI